MALLGSDTQVTGPFPRGVLLLETLVGEEALGRPFRFELGFLSEEPYLDSDLVLGHPLAVGLELASGAFRYFHGVVTSFGKEGVSQRHTRYSATLEPAFARLAYTSDCRIFGEPGQTALDLVTTVLTERAATPFEAGAVQGHAFRARELCVQYRESDLHFVQRLLEEEGLYYFFRHEEGKDTLVLANGLGAHAPAAGYELVAYAPKERHVAGAEEHFWQMRARQGLGPGRHTVLAGYDPTALRPRQPRYGEARSEALAPGLGFEHYDYPGGLFDPEEASREAALRGEADHVEQTFVEVEGNTVGLGVGDLVALRPAFAIDENVPFWRPEDYGKQHLVVAASYRLSIDQYETGEVAGADEGFVGTYQLLDTEHAFRPARSTGKPRMGGPQTALVVGPASEEIWTDALGRVRIQFDWDRLGGKNEKSTCWVRTAHAWAGPQWGGQHIPRIGQEVLVRFLDGDPDRPIVAGSLYSADNLPPYGLPSDATQSGIKSRSSKGGTAANYNELRFEDKQGAEELHLQAERDMSTVVKHCQTLRVGADRSILVGNDETNLVKANRDLTMRPEGEDTPPGKDTVVIKGAHDKTIVGPVLQIYADDHSRKVDGEQELAVEKNKHEHVKQAHTLTTDQKFQLNQGDTSLTFKNKNVTLDSAGEVVVTAGGATVSMDQAGLTTFESPAGITLTCGASSIAVTPGGVAIAAPAFTMAAGGGSKLSLGADAVAISSKKVAIEAGGVCKLRGKKALKLQESEKAKGRKTSGAGGAGDVGKSLAGDLSLTSATDLPARAPGAPSEAPREQFSTPLVGMSDGKAVPEPPQPAVECGHPPYSNLAEETKTIVCSSGVFRWTGRFDVRLTEREVQIGVRIKLVNRLGPKPTTSGVSLPPVGPPLSSAEKAEMKSDIETKLSNKRLFHRAQCAQGNSCGCPKSKGCCKLRVRIFVDFVESGQHHEVNLFQGPGRADSANWTRVKTRANTYAHETGHLLGFYDEYAGGAVGPAPRWTIQSDVVMATGLRVPPEYYWDFRDWLRDKCGGECWDVAPP